MEYRKDTVIWSENWWVEGDRAWFVEGANNILFCANLNTEEYEEAINIPDTCLDKYKLTPYCMKCGNAVFCIPGRGRYIWIYHLEEREFSRIDLGKNEDTQWAIEVWVWQGTFFLVLDRLNKILEIDAGIGRIVNSYIICDDSVVRSTIAEDSIFMLSSKSDMIYRFECNTKNIESYMLPDIGKKFFNISFDGERFLLSGYDKEIYVWDHHSNRLAVLNNSPENFGIYNYISKAENKLVHYEIPTFFYERTVGKYVWFIPGRAKKIVYVDRRSGEISTFELNEESVTWENILSSVMALPQYLWEYVRDDRYIGLFSARNNRIVEIDVEKLEYQWKDYSISNKCVQQCDKIFNGIYTEGNMLHKELYQRRFQTTVSDAGNFNRNSIGSGIYSNLKKGSEQ